MSQFFGKAVHTAFVVPDIDRVIRRMLASGIGPVYLMSRMRVAARYRSVRNDILISAAFVNTGSVQYEFVAQHDKTPSAYREFLERNPQGGFHHAAYFCKSFDEALAHAADKGTRFDIVQEFITPDGAPFEIYVEPRNVEDPLLAQLMIPGPMSKFFDDMERIAASWEGKDPIRDALALLPPEMRPPTEPI